MKVKVLKIIDKRTLKAVSSTYKKHPLYKKYLLVYKKYLVDYLNGIPEVGQYIEISESRPLSKSKKWIIKSSNKLSF